MVFEIKLMAAVVLGALFCSVALASSKIKEEHRTAFFGEDIYINVPPKELGELVFKPRANLSIDVVLLQGGHVLTPPQPQGNLSGPEVHLISPGHIILDNLQEKDEGVYIIRSNTSSVVRKLTVVVRDCAVEQIIKYGDHYDIHLSHVEGPITLEFTPSLSPSNQTDTTDPPPVLLFNQSVLLEEYEGRLSVSERKVTLRSVRMSDEGSYTVLDKNGKVRRRNCLNVREHQNFVHLTYGSNLKLNLYLHHSSLNVVYRPRSDPVDRPVVEQGAVVSPLDPQLEGRLTVEGAVIHMKKLLESDTGVFKLTDLAGNSVAHIYIEVEPYRLPNLTVAILSLLGLVAFMLLICLLSCLYKVHERNEKNKKLRLLAQQSKGDGEAFRQVVHEAYTRFTEESLMQSMCDQPSESTEVTIKGLEVSKPGRYQTLPSDNNLMEMSDSGVEFNNSGLPLDSDTDGGLTYASHKPLLNAVSPTAISEVPNNSPDLTAANGELSATRTPDSILSASPASNPRSFAVATPDGSQQGAASPRAASRGTTEPSKGGDESGDAVVQNDTTQST